MADINHLPAIITCIRTIYILYIIYNRLAWARSHCCGKFSFIPHHVFELLRYTEIFWIFFFPSLSLGATFICSRVYWTVVDQIVFIFSFNFLLVLLCSWVIFNFCHTRVERLLCFHLFALGFLPHLVFFLFIFSLSFYFIHIYFIFVVHSLCPWRVCVCVWPAVMVCAIL